MRDKQITKTQSAILLTIISCLLLSFKTTIQKGFLVDLDSVASVQFPSRPISQTINGVTVHSIRTPEMAFIAMVMDQGIQKPPVKNIHSFYLGFMDTMIRDTKSTLLDSASFNLKEHEGMDFSYFNSSTNGSKVVRKSRVLLIKNKLYCWGYTLFDEQTEASKASSKMCLESFFIK